MPKKIALLIVDLDGTLLDTKHDISYSLNATLAEFGLAMVAEEVIAEHVGEGIMPLIRERVPAEKVDAFTRQFEETYLTHIADRTRPFPGWEEVLPRLTSLKLVILTNKLQKFTDAVVAALYLERYFSAAYGREAFPERKPSALPVLGILEKMGVPAEQTLMIGDMPADILAGKAAGTQTCAALFGYGKRHVLTSLSPTFALEHPVELLPILGF